MVKLGRYQPQKIQSSHLKQEQNDIRQDWNHTNKVFIQTMNILSVLCVVLVLSSVVKRKYSTDIILTISENGLKVQINRQN